MTTKPQKHVQPILTRDRIQIVPPSTVGWRMYPIPEDTQIVFVGAAAAWHGGCLPSIQIPELELLGNGMLHAKFAVVTVHAAPMNAICWTGRPHSFAAQVVPLPSSTGLQTVSFRRMGPMEVIADGHLYHGPAEIRPGVFIERIHPKGVDLRWSRVSRLFPRPLVLAACFDRPRRLLPC